MIDFYLDTARHYLFMSKTATDPYSKQLWLDNAERATARAERSLAKMISQTPQIEYHPPISRPPQSLEELNNNITEKLAKWDVFDFDLPEDKLEAVKRIIEGRGLKWVNVDLDDEPCAYEGVITIVVGKPDANFEEHEELR